MIEIVHQLADLLVLRERLHLAAVKAAPDLFRAFHQGADGLVDIAVEEIEGGDQQRDQKDKDREINGQEGHPVGEHRPAVQPGDKGIALIIYLHVQAAGAFISLIGKDHALVPGRRLCFPGGSKDCLQPGKPVCGHFCPVILSVRRPDIHNILIQKGNPVFLPDHIVHTPEQPVHIQLQDKGGKRLIIAQDNVAHHIHMAGQADQPGLCVKVPGRKAHRLRRIPLELLYARVGSSRHIAVGIVLHPHIVPVEQDGIGDGPGKLVGPVQIIRHGPVHGIFIPVLQKCLIRFLDDAVIGSLPGIFDRLVQILHHSAAGALHGGMQGIFHLAGIAHDGNPDQGCGQHNIGDDPAGQNDPDHPRSEPAGLIFFPNVHPVHIRSSPSLFLTALHIPQGFTKASDSQILFESRCILCLYRNPRICASPHCGSWMIPRNVSKSLQTAAASSAVDISLKIRSRGSVPEKRAITHPPFLKYTFTPSR